MTRAELIAATKVKLEEISPFEEPSSFIIAAGDTDYDKVKPITSYIDDTLDKAAVYCHNNLPASLLGNDIDSTSVSASLISNEGTAIVDMSSAAISRYYVRLIRVSVPDFWKRPCTTFITTADTLYLLQLNKYTRGGTAKPVVAFNPENDNILELYSFPKSAYGTMPRVSIQFIRLYNPPDGTEIPAESIQSPIGDYIALQCAAMVCDIMGNPNQAEILRQQYNRKLEDILH